MMRYRIIGIIPLPCEGWKEERNEKRLQEEIHIVVSGHVFVICMYLYGRFVSYITSTPTENNPREKYMNNGYVTFSQTLQCNHHSTYTYTINKYRYPVNNVPETVGWDRRQASTAQLYNGNSDTNKLHSWMLLTEWPSILQFKNNNKKTKTNLLLVWPAIRVSAGSWSCWGRDRPLLCHRPRTLDHCQVLPETRGRWQCRRRWCCPLHRRRTQWSIWSLPELSLPVGTRPSSPTSWSTSMSDISYCHASLSHFLIYTLDQLTSNFFPLLYTLNVNTWNTLR